MHFTLITNMLSTDSYVSSIWGSDWQDNKSKIKTLSFPCNRNASPLLFWPILDFTISRWICCILKKHSHRSLPAYSFFTLQIHCKTTKSKIGQTSEGDICYMTVCISVTWEPQSFYFRFIVLPLLTSGPYFRWIHWKIRLHNIKFCYDQLSWI